jgi:hypothetical protein
VRAQEGDGRLHVAGLLEAERDARAAALAVGPHLDQQRRVALRPQHRRVAEERGDRRTVGTGEEHDRRLRGLDGDEVGDEVDAVGRRQGHPLRGHRVVGGGPDLVEGDVTVDHRVGDQRRDRRQHAEEDRQGDEQATGEPSAPAPAPPFGSCALRGRVHVPLHPDPGVGWPWSTPP